jgi:ABC-type uncharacterized transport system auxiliary subunit
VKLNLFLPLRLFAIILMSLVLSGCGAMKPLPSDTFYRLRITAPTAGDTSRTPWTEHLIRVVKFRASGVHRERAIVYSGDASLVVQQHRHHLWVDSPERMLQQELIQYLRSIGVAPLVSSSESRGDGFEIRGEIRQMDQVMQDGGTRVTVGLAFELVSLSGQPRLILAREYQKSLVTNGKELIETADALSAAIEFVFAQFVGDVDELLNK